MKITRQIVQKVVYIGVFSILIIYLYSLGSGPWIHFAEHWPVFFTTAAVHAIAIFIQAFSFRSVQTSENILALDKMVRIWSFSGFVSVIAPVFAGLATRTTLLVRAGLSLSECVTASLRQIWMGLEYACLLGGLAGLLVEIQGVRLFAVGMIISGVILIIIRLFVVKPGDNLQDRKWKWIASLRTAVNIKSHPWFIAQLLAMGVIYYIAFNGVNASIGIQDSIFIAGVTVLASIIVMIPNGLGVMDGLWVLVARQAGLGLDESVALVLMLRLSYLVGAGLVWVGLLSMKQVKNRTT